MKYRGFVTDFDFVPPGIQPNCMASDRFTTEGCAVCEDDELSCPCLIEPDYCSYLRERWEHRWLIAEERRKQGEKIADAIKTVLGEMGLPLHWQVITRIVVSRFPEVTTSENYVYAVLCLRKDLFTTVEPGVYDLV